MPTRGKTLPFPRWTKWTKKQELALLNHLGVSGVSKLKREVGSDKSESAIVSKAYRKYGTSRLTRGTYSLRQVMIDTGYGITQLQRAQKALRQRWHRTRPGGQFMITLAQLDELVSWLRTDYWASHKPLYGCVWCTMDTRPLHGYGLCSRCYFQYRRRSARAGLPVKFLDQLALGERYLAGGDNDILIGIVERLRGGLALSRRQLDALGRWSSDEND